MGNFKKFGSGYLLKTSPSAIDCKSGLVRRAVKIPAVAAVQRGGDVRFRMMERVTGENIGNFVKENADQLAV
jgi:hypothetical protein